VRFLVFFPPPSCCSVTIRESSMYRNGRSSRMIWRIWGWLFSSPTAVESGFCSIMCGWATADAPICWLG
jgi:hypothetical protein